MAIEVTIPRLGWNMDEGIFIGWLKSDGQRVVAGEPLFNLEGDKATQDIESLETGILRIPPMVPRKVTRSRSGRSSATLSGPTSLHPLHQAVPADPPRSRILLPDTSQHRITQSSCSGVFDSSESRPRPARRPGTGHRHHRAGRQWKDRPHSRARRPCGGTSPTHPCPHHRQDSGRWPVANLRSLPGIPRNSRQHGSEDDRGADASECADDGRRDDHDDGGRYQPGQPAATVQGRGPRRVRHRRSVTPTSSSS